MTEILDLSRRDFLKTGAAAGGGLLIGFYLPLGNRLAAQQSNPPFAPNAFIRIGTDDSVTVIVNHSEMGQGVYTALPMLVAEELDADWSKVRVESAPVDAAYNHTAFGIQMTGGSSSTWSEYDRLRKAGATARAMLVAAAADTWKVDPASLRTQNGFVIHDATKRRLSYGQLAEKASTMTPPQNVPLKDPKDFRLIGRPTKRLDTPEKINGKGMFGLDVVVPNMLVAVVARPPVFGGKVRSFNADKAKAIAGVRDVVQIDRGVAVVADGFWPAKLGREALDIAWDEGSLAGLDSSAQRDQYAQLAKEAGAVAKKEGDAAAAMSQATTKLEAVYEVPYLAHAPMEPLNCVADVRADGADVWTGTQFQTMEQMIAAQTAGL